MRLVVPVVLLAGIVALTGCAPPTTGDPGAQPAPAQAGGPGPGNPAGPIVGFTGDLRTLLLARPAGATNAADPKSDGTITIEQAAGSFDNPTQGLTQLRALGFARGAIEQWRETDGTEVSDIVFLFGDHPSATTFTYAAQNSYALNQLFDAPIAIPGIPLGNAYQLTAAGPDKKFLTEVFFIKNSMTVELSIIGPSKMPSTRAVSLAQAQYALLP